MGCPAPDPIFVVGLPRSGSTLIEQILASHSQVEGTMELPDVAMLARVVGGRTTRTAGSAYPRALEKFSADELRALGERYLAQTRIQRKTPAPIFIDKMPNNFAHVGLIHLMLPNAKIVDARRHPLGCCFSAFKQHFARGQNFTYDLAEIGRYYRDYVELMAHFDAVLPGRVHRVLYENMVEDTEGEVRRLLDYCGLPFEEAVLRFHENQRAVRTASSEQVRQPIFKEGVDHWRHYEPWLAPLKEALGDVVSALSRHAAVLNSWRRAYTQPTGRVRTVGNRTPTFLTRHQHKITGITHDTQQTAQDPTYSIEAGARTPDGLPARGRHARRRSASCTRNRWRSRAPASKRSSSPRSRPGRTCRTCRVSIQAIGTERLEELNVTSFDDYVKYLPSVSYQSAGPGFARVFMRGAAAGDNGNHSGPQPGVGQYLDEQPITTIQGALDIHMYDIARVEALAGPQGTLYGASSQSGTIRIITNKPDTSGFDAAYSIQGSDLAHGDLGYLGEGFANIPLGDNAAIRLVGWVRHDGGYIDNVAATRTFPTSGISMDSLARGQTTTKPTPSARAPRSRSI